MNICYLLIVGAFAGLVISVGEGNGQQNQSSTDKYMDEAEVQIILGACYLHADRPNPVQDLVDKGLVSTDFASDTCISVKQGSEQAQKIKEDAQIETGHAEFARRASESYNECLTERAVGCWNIISEFCVNPAYARYVVQDCQGITGKQEASPYAQLNNETK